jgi:hypothetical protein
VLGLKLPGKVRIKYISEKDSTEQLLENVGVVKKGTIFSTKMTATTPVAMSTGNNSWEKLLYSLLTWAL